MEQKKGEDQSKLDCRANEREEKVLHYITCLILCNGCTTD